MAILFGMLMNQRGLEKLEKSFEGVDDRLERMQADLNQFYRSLGEH